MRKFQSAIDARLSAFIALLCAVTWLAFTPGCAQKLQPGGAYAPALVNPDGSVTPTAAPDMALFVLDASYDLAYQTVLTACRLEKQNRPLLGRVFPELKREMDKVRIATWQIDQDWAAARAAYLDHPVAANLTAIQRALAEMERWNAVATALLPKANAPPLPP